MGTFAHIILIAGFSLGLTAADIQPVARILNSRCLDCHDSDTNKGGINLAKLLAADNLNRSRTAALWEKLDKAVRTGEMPPENKEPLTDSEKAQIAK